MNKILKTIVLSLPLLLAASLFGTVKPKKTKCSIYVGANDMMRYVDHKKQIIKEITIPKSCKNFTVDFHHTGNIPKAAMGHNFLITKTSNVNKVIQAALIRGPSYDYQVDSKEVLVSGKKELNIVLW